MAWAIEKDVRAAMLAALADYSRNRLPGVLLPSTYELIENKSNVGTFDTFIACGGRSAWIELKFAGPNAAPKMRAGQPGFGFRMKAAKQPAVVMIGHADESYRLIAPDTLGPDWRGKMLEKGRHLDWRVIERIFDNDWAILSSEKICRDWERE